VRSRWRYERTHVEQWGRTASHFCIRVSQVRREDGDVDEEEGVQRCAVSGPGMGAESQEHSGDPPYVPPASAVRACLPLPRLGRRICLLECTGSLQI
jgi:hypothetical protein